MAILEDDQSRLHRTFDRIVEAQPYPWRKIRKLFDWLQRMDDLNLNDDAIDDCMFRAHIMCRRVMDLGVAPYKAWAFSWYGLQDGRERRLYPKKLCNVPKNGWRDHVTLALPAVLQNGRCDFAILDPVVADRPLTKMQWAESLRIRSSQCQICAFGEIPEGAKGDFFPDYDQTTYAREALAYLDNLSAQALKITRQYKKLTLE